MNSTLLPNSATLRKNNNTTNTRCVYSGRFFHPTIWPGQVSFPWIWWRFFNPPGTLGFPQSREETGGETETFRSEKKRSCRGSRIYYFYIFLIGAKYLFQVTSWVFFCANWICVCVFFVCFGFWNWNYMKGMSKTKVETDWTAEPCLCFELFSKWVDQITKKTNVLLHMQCFALLFPNKFACSIVGNMLTSSYSHQLVDVPGSSPWSEVEKSQKTPGGNPGSPTGHHFVKVVGFWISPFFNRFSSCLEDDPFLLAR